MAEPLTAPNKGLIPHSPPKTRGLPLVGTLPEIMKKGVFNFLLDARARYGDIYLLNLGVTKVIILNHPRHAQHVLLQNARNYRKAGSLWTVIRNLVGNGLVASEGEFWLKQRRMMQPHFNREQLGSLTNLMVDAIDEGMADWDQTVISSQAVNIAEECPRITLKVIVKSMFGAGINLQEANEINKEFTFVLDYLLQGMLTSSFPSWLPVPGQRRYRQAVQLIDDVVFRFIESRRQTGEEANDLLTTLLHMVDQESGDRMTSRQLRDEAVTMFLAGYETTATALSWILYNLALYPDVAHKVQAEIDRHIGTDRPTFSSLMDLTYTHQVVQETLRLYPPAWWILRMANEDDEMDGFYIPANTMVAPMPYVIHRHPEVWQKPDQFDPERFTPERSLNQHKLAWLPFGSGQRQCIGKDLTMMESKLILIRLMQRYHITAVPNFVPQEHAAMTFRSKNGILLHLAKRA